MRTSVLTGRVLFLLSIAFIISCTQKTKNEQPAADSISAPLKTEKKTDSIAKSEVPQVVTPEEKKPEVIAVKPASKKATEPQKPVEKQTAPQPVKEVVKAPVVEPKKEPVKEPVVVPPVIAPPPVVKEAEKKIEPPKVDSSALKKPEAKPKGKPYYFKVVRKDDGKEIFGNLQLEAVGATQFQVVKSGQIIYLEEPTNRRGTYNIAALIPGYRQSSLIFGFNSPSIEKGSKDEEIVTLTLEKARRGDYIDFNNVHFFKNTSIMRPVSQAELDELVALMKESPNYKIKIYGFCNGTQARESYTMGTSKNFFGMEPKANKKETISSKALSEARAENVKAYLVQQGVEAARISTKGEGGKVPLYLESGTLAQYNDRIEIEFVKH